MGVVGLIRRRDGMELSVVGDESHTHTVKQKHHQNQYQKIKMEAFFFFALLCCFFKFLSFLFLSFLFCFFLFLPMSL